MILSGILSGRRGRVEAGMDRTRPSPWRNRREPFWRWIHGWPAVDTRTWRKQATQPHYIEAQHRCDEHTEHRDMKPEVAWLTRERKQRPDSPGHEHWVDDSTSGKQHRRGDSNRDERHSGNQEGKRKRPTVAITRRRRSGLHRSNYKGNGVVALRAVLAFTRVRPREHAPRTAEAWSRDSRVLREYRRPS